MATYRASKKGRELLRKLANRVVEDYEDVNATRLAMLLDARNHLIHTELVEEEYGRRAKTVLAELVRHSYLDEVPIVPKSARKDYPRASWMK